MEALRTDTESRVDQYVVFRLGDAESAIDIAFVEEFRPINNISPIPCTPAFVAGAINVRGRIVPVIDLAAFSRPGRREYPARAKAIVINKDSSHFGILADDLLEVAHIRPEEIDARATGADRHVVDFAAGATEEGLTVLDIEAIVADKRLIVHEEV